MNLVALDIPDRDEELPAWLERHLVALELEQLVAELTAINPVTGAAQTLDDVLGADKSNVLESGLQILSRDKLRQLLKQPGLLKDLKQLVLLEGGDYWQALAINTPDLTSIVNRSRGPLLENLQLRDAPADKVQVAPRNSVAFYKRPVWVALLTAAAVVLIMLNVQRPAPPNNVKVAGWGWSKPGAIPLDVSPAQKFDVLAQTADEWFKKRPTDARGVAIRIVEFRQGCTELLLADHQKLAAKDRTWLLNHCRKWAKEFDQMLAEAESGEHDPLDIRGRMDKLVEVLVKELKERSAEIAKAEGTAVS